MGIENPTPTYIDDLDASSPGATDPLSQADDHIRNIKRAVKQTFPNVSGAVTATDASLNLLSGLQSIADAVYPVGCIYESTVATSPSTLFPGTSWTAFGQGKMLVGLDPNDGDFNSTSDTGGSKTVALTTSEMPQHNHSFSGSSGSAGSHTHTISGTAASGGSHSHGTNLRHASTNATYTGITGSTTSVTSGSYSVEHRDTTSGRNGFSSTLGNLTTSHTGHTHSVSGSTNTAGSHSHSISGTVGNKGSGDAHDNMPPYIVVYRWKRDS
jgi:microcystin-dependent protein